MESDKKRLSELNKESKIAVLCGGMSAEREVSLRSGKNVHRALLELGYKNAQILDVGRDVAQKLHEGEYEFAFNVLHGRYGEDGCIQGLLEIMGIKYTGCDVKSSALCMDKETTKNILATCDIPLISSVCAYNLENLEQIVSGLDYPLMVKPVKEGSSIGMSRVENFDELKEAFKLAKKSDNKILIEEYYQGKSATIGVLQKKTQNGIETFATPILGFETKTQWYDYEAKYTKGLTRFILPADFDEEMTKNMQNIAIKAFEACECRGVARVDFLVYNNTPYVLEINTNPGMTDLSDLPAQANHMGIDYNSLVELILKTSEF